MSCGKCVKVRLLRNELVQNISLLAESGFAEGQMCHMLMKGSRAERMDVAISAPMIVR